MRRLLKALRLRVAACLYVAVVLIYPFRKGRRPALRTAYRVIVEIPPAE